MGRPYRDESGNIYGHLKVVSYYGLNNQGAALWNCICSCGNTVVTEGYTLRRGSAKGCSNCNVAKTNQKTGHGHNWKNKLGHKQGKLTVIKELSTRNNAGYINYLCECECGNQIIVPSNRLNRSSSPRSCGCLFRLPLQEGSFRTVYRRIKRAAKIRNLSWELDETYVKEITSKNCFYCNTPPQQKTLVTKNYGVYVYNGIDRIDSSLGYTKENVVPCCGRCNSAKSNLNIDEFKSLIFNIYQNWIKPELEL